jgi:zinc protease
VGVNPASVDRAIVAVVIEMALFCASGPIGVELSDALYYLSGCRALGLETNDGIAGTLLGIERYGLGLDYISRYPDIIRGISAEQIVDVARKYLSTENYVVVTAGPAVS